MSSFCSYHYGFWVFVLYLGLPYNIKTLLWFLSVSTRLFLFFSIQIIDLSGINFDEVRGQLYSFPRCLSM